MKDLRFSVLMSVYHKETSSNLKEALISIYDNQTLKPNEIVLVEDGELTDELYKVIKSFENGHAGILKSVKLNKNVGLGLALNEGIKHCSFDLVARMDTDDIATNERFALQIEYISKNSKVDVLGGQMLEFTDTISNIHSKKTVPVSNDAIKHYLKTRNPMNHVTVLFKKKSVLKAGNYTNFLYFEDYYLWARMVSQNYVFHNLEDVLVYVRVGEEVYKRRGGLFYTKTNCKFQLALYKLKLISFSRVCINSVIRIVNSLLPNFVRKHIYMNVLRKKVANEEGVTL